MLKAANRYQLVRSLGIAVLAGTLLWSGGFWLEVTTASSDDGMTFLVRPAGCHDPGEAGLQARAEGLVEGIRQSVDLDLVPLGDDLYQIRRQWPSKGVWLVSITGRYRGMTRSVLIQMDDSGTVLSPEHSATHAGPGNVPRSLTDAEIESALLALAGKSG